MGGAGGVVGVWGCGRGFGGAWKGAGWEGACSQDVQRYASQYRRWGGGSGGRVGGVVGG